MRRRPGRMEGFTLIELMVVVAIIVLAAGLMTPTITDFFRNRQLDGIRGHFGSAFNTARLKAVTEGSRMSLVFFREGARVFSERTQGFLEDDLFNPETSPLAERDVWFVLGFLDNKPSTSLPAYREWEKSGGVVSPLVQPAKSGGSKSIAKGGKEKGSARGYNVRDLPRVTFERDGSLTFAAGSDVDSGKFKKEPPEGADVVIYQAGNNSACFIDLRMQGQFRSKMVPLSEVPPRPQVESATSTAAPATATQEAAAQEAAQETKGVESP